jgi:hypothetical protein
VLLRLRNPLVPPNAFGFRNVASIAKALNTNVSECIEQILRYRQDKKGKKQEREEGETI